MYVCMAGQRQMQRPWQEPDSARFSTPAQSTPEQGQIPGIATALGRQLPINNNHRLPPIATSFNARAPRPQDGLTDSADLGSVRSSQPGSPLRSSSTRPGKRARWHLGQDSTAVFGTRAVRADSHYHEHDGNREPHATSSRVENITLSSQQERVCSNCASTDHLVAKIVSGLLTLEENIRNALALSQTSQNNTGADISKFGLKHSLLFASQCIEANSRLVREVAANRPGRKPLATDVTNDTEPGSQSGNFNVTTELTEPHSNPLAIHLEDRIPYNAPDAPEDVHLGLPERTSHPTPLNKLNIMRRTTYHEEPPPARAALSPRGSPQISTFDSTQSPVPSHPSNRTLPSPSSYIPYPSSASSIPSSYGDGSLSAAQASHLQDLQHQISTKTLALQTLQREHDQLLAAFSRSQIRCATLDKKSQVSDHEINTLSEEKMRLQQQVEALETQVAELSRDKDEARRQISTDGAQWQRIMAMSSQLQARSAEETRQFRSDREAWERDRDGLQSRIQDLEAGRLMVGPSSDAIAVSNDDILESTSLETLREEILRLRRRCGEIEGLLREIQGETEHMGPILATLTNVNVRISTLSSQARSNPIIGRRTEDWKAPTEGG